MAPGFSHRQIWAALDALAERHGLSASGLARKAGLDPTTFNPSKRTSPGGRQRWPSTESIAKALAATGEAPGEFLALLDARGGAEPRPSGRLIALADAAKDGSFDSAGRPAGSAWTEADLFAGADGERYALKLSGDALAPLYRDGDMLIVSPGASAKRGDRVVVKTAAGELLIAELKGQSAGAVELRPLANGACGRVLAQQEIVWMSRIIWASQ